MYNKPLFIFINMFNNHSVFKESMEACRNMVPVSKVVYNILTKLEEPFNLSFLEMLFSHINLREYPNLEAIHRSFRNGMRFRKYLWAIEA